MTWEKTVRGSWGGKAEWKCRCWKERGCIRQGVGRGWEPGVWPEAGRQAPGEVGRGGIRVARL